MRIKTFETSLTGKSKVSEIEEIPFTIPKARQRNSGRKYESLNRIAFGKHWHRVLEENERLAYDRKAKDNAQLQREFLQAYPSDMALRYRFKTYKLTVGMYRKKYNQQVLFQSQPPVFLVSFQYDMSSTIVVGGIYPSTYMSFQDCYQRCVNLKIADPRFVPHDYIVKIRDRQNDGDEEWLEWIVPDEKELRTLRRYLQVDELYNSVHFPQGWTREETPIDYECPYE